MDYEDDEEERAIILNHKLTPVQRIPVKSQYEKPGLLDGELSPEEEEPKTVIQKYEGVIDDIDKSLQGSKEELEIDTSKYSKYDVMMDDLVAVGAYREASTGASKAEQVMAELDLLSDEEDEMRLL